MIAIIVRREDARALNWFKESAARRAHDASMDIAPEDLRGLPAPEPLLRVLERISGSEGPHAFLLPFAPTPLYPLLGSYGWQVDTCAVDDGVVVTLVRIP